MNSALPPAVLVVSRSRRSNKLTRFASTITATMVLSLAMAGPAEAINLPTSAQVMVAAAVTVYPSVPEFADKSGTAYDTYTIPAKAGVQYYANGVAKAAGTYKGVGTVTVTAKAKSGYALSGTTSWKRAFSTAVIVTPTAASFADKSGTAYDTYTIPAKTGVQYYANGVAKAAGTYKGVGTVTVTAKAKSGYALSGTTSWKRTFSTAVIVTPTAASFADKSGTAYDRYTIPAKAGVQYYANGVAKAAGTYKGSGTVTITAKAKSGYALTGATSWKRTFTTGTVVATTAPSFHDGSGTWDDTFAIPDVPGVVYYVNGQEYYPGRFSASHFAVSNDPYTVTITAKAAPGFALSGTTSWKRTYSTNEHVAPAAPIFSNSAASYTIPSEWGVIYYVDGVSKPAGTYPGAGTVKVTAKARPGFTLTGTTSWTKTYTTTAVSTSAPSFNDGSGSWDDTFTIPDVPGVVYYVNGQEYYPGRFNASHFAVSNDPYTVTITAKAAPSFTLSGTTSWEHTYSTDELVAPAAPIFSNSAASYTIPSEWGVIYYVDGVSKPAGTYPGAGTVTVTAKARPGFALTGTTSWTKTYTTTTITRD
jgi:hypothetical protein